MKGLMLILLMTVACYAFSLAYDHLCLAHYDAFFRHPEDCHKYIRCSHRRAYIFHCPANLLWHHEIKSCDFSYRTRCKVNELGVRGSKVRSKKKLAGLKNKCEGAKCKDSREIDAKIESEAIKDSMTLKPQKSIKFLTNISTKIPGKVKRTVKNNRKNSTVVKANNSRAESVKLNVKHNTEVMLTTLTGKLTEPNNVNITTKEYSVPNQTTGIYLQTLNKEQNDTIASNGNFSKFSNLSNKVLVEVTDKENNNFKKFAKNCHQNNRIDHKNPTSQLKFTKNVKIKEGEHKNVIKAMDNTFSPENTIITLKDFPEVLGATESSVYYLKEFKNVSVNITKENQKNVTLISGNSYNPEIFTEIGNKTTLMEKKNYFNSTNLTEPLLKSHTEASAIAGSSVNSFNGTAVLADLESENTIFHKNSMILLNLTEMEMPDKNFSIKSTELPSTTLPEDLNLTHGYYIKKTGEFVKNITNSEAELTDVSQTEIEQIPVKTTKENTKLTVENTHKNNSLKPISLTEPILSDYLKNLTVSMENPKQTFNLTPNGSVKTTDKENFKITVTAEKPTDFFHLTENYNAMNNSDIFTDFYVTAIDTVYEYTTDEENVKITATASNTVNSFDLIEDSNKTNRSDISTEFDLIQKISGKADEEHNLSKNFNVNNIANFTENSSADLITLFKSTEFSSDLNESFTETHSGNILTDFMVQIIDGENKSVISTEKAVNFTETPFEKNLIDHENENLNINENSVNFMSLTEMSTELKANNLSLKDSNKTFEKINYYNLKQNFAENITDVIATDFSVKTTYNANITSTETYPNTVRIENITEKLLTEFTFNTVDASTVIDENITEKLLTESNVKPNDNKKAHFADFHTETISDIKEKSTTAETFLKNTENWKEFTTTAVPIVSYHLYEIDNTTQDPRLPFRSIECQGENNRRQFKASKCYQYYQCFAGWAFLLNCHEGWWFQPTEGQCVLDVNRECEF